MHELGLAQDLFRIVAEKAQENKLKKVTKLRIKVGVASGIEADFLRHSLLEHTLPETMAEGAELEFVEELLLAQCPDCQKEIKAQAQLTLSCPDCGSRDIEITQGKDVYLESIEGDI